MESLLLNYSKIKQNKREVHREKPGCNQNIKKLVTLKDDIELNIDIDKISDCEINTKN